MHTDLHTVTHRERNVKWASTARRIAEEKNNQKKSVTAAIMKQLRHT